jgi:hypothetical protein
VALTCHLTESAKKLTKFDLRNRFVITVYHKDLP